MSSHRSLAGAAAGGWPWGVKEAKFWSPKSAEELYKRSLSPHSHRIATRGPSSHFALGHSSSQKKKKIYNYLGVLGKLRGGNEIVRL